MVRAVRRWGRLSYLLMAFAIPGCSSAAVRSWQGSVDTIGDTIVVTTSVPPEAAWPSLEVVDSVPLVWTSELLARPSDVAVSPGETVYVADVAQVFAIGPTGEHVATLGRQGRGPGEFTRITSLALYSGDTVLVWDGVERRLTWLKVDGGVARTRIIAPPTGFRPPRPLDRTPRPLDLQPTPAGLPLPWQSGAFLPAGPPDTLVLALTAWNHDSVVILRRLPNIAWLEAGVVGVRYPFGPRALFAVGTGGTFAYANGVDYCVTMQRVGEPGARRICRHWQRARTSRIDRVPADTVGLGGIGPLLVQLATAQEYGRLAHSIDEIRLDAASRLWVRVVDSSYKTNPLFTDRLPRFRPEHYTWEVFDVEGKLARRIALPSGFLPRGFANARVYGLVELPNGAFGVGRLDIGVP
jgi:hypothetical protein